MTNDSVITNSGKVIMLNRTYKASPDYTAPAVFQVGTGQTTPSISATGLTTPLTIGASTVKTFVTNYPTIDETNKEVTIRGYLSSTECNGQNIDGSGIRSQTGGLFSLDKFNSESKSSTDEFVWVWVDRLL